MAERYPIQREDLTPREWRQRIFDGGVRKNILRMESKDDRRPHCVYVHRDLAGNTRYVGRGLRARPWCHRRRDPRHVQLLLDGSLQVEVVHDGLTARESVVIERHLLEEIGQAGGHALLNRLFGTSMELNTDVQ
jgi:hypothetical protein